MEENKDFIQSLKEYFENASIEKIREDWEKTKEMDEVDPTVEEFEKSLPSIYPLISNKRWYAENGIVYNSADDEVQIVLLHDSGSYSNLPNGIAEIIAFSLNNGIGWEL